MDWVIIFNIAFKQRNDAFDFFDCVVQFKEKLVFEREIEKNKGKEEEKKQDFSLKQGDSLGFGNNPQKAAANSQNSDFKFKFSAPGKKPNTSTPVKPSDSNNVGQKNPPSSGTGYNLIDL